MPEQEKPEVISKQIPQQQERKKLPPENRNARAKQVSPSQRKPVPLEQQSMKAEVEKIPQSEPGSHPGATGKQARQPEETQKPQELEKNGKQRSPELQDRVSDQSTVLEPEEKQVQVTHHASTEVHKQPAPTKEREVLEKSSQDEIRKKINAVLDDTNN